MPRKGVPVTAAVRAKVLDLHDKGLGRNDIARLVECSTATVSRIVREDGRKFDTSKTAALTDKRLADLTSMRASLAVKMIAKAHDLLDDLDKPFLAFNFGGKDNTYEQHELARPPADAIRNLMQSASIAAQRSMDLSKFDADPNEGGAAVDQWLAHMLGED